MIYLLAIILSMFVCWQSFAAEVVAGNIKHLKCGRAPNAGAAIILLVPMVQLLAVAGTWALDSFVPQFAFWIIIGLFLAFTVFWAIRFTSLRAEFAALASAREAHKEPE